MPKQATNKNSYRRSLQISARMHAMSNSRNQPSHGVRARSGLTIKPYESVEFYPGNSLRDPRLLTGKAYQALSRCVRRCVF